MKSFFSKVLLLLVKLSKMQETGIIGLINVVVNTYKRCVQTESKVEAVGVSLRAPEIPS